MPDFVHFSLSLGSLQIDIALFHRLVQYALLVEFIQCHLKLNFFLVKGNLEVQVVPLGHLNASDASCEVWLVVRDQSLLAVFHLIRNVFELRRDFLTRLLESWHAKVFIELLYCPLQQIEMMNPLVEESQCFATKSKC